MPVHIVEELVKQRRDSPTLTAIGGEPLINVLLLNLALDRYHEGN